MTFPISDHCDGQVFFNPAIAAAPPAPRRGAWARLGFLLRWQFSRRERGAWPAAVMLPGFPPPDARAVPARGAAVTFLGHASFLIRLPGCTILTDPVFSPRASPFSFVGPKRVAPPGVALADLPPVDLVLLSHNHYDHMDLTTLRALAARFAPRFLTTLGNRAFLARHAIAAEELDWWDTHTHAGLRITATPARHFAARWLHDRNRTLWAGFMIAGAGGRILFAGDSGAGPHWAEIAARLGAPDLALLPIGAYAPAWMMQPVHMNPEEAVAAHQALGARRSLGMHFGTFRMADEAYDEPPARLRAAAARAAVDFDVPGLGETRVFPFD
ncbi:MAG: MBL fold metallo-hydrolase [Rhodospirillales bacterium]|nr:MBL fold metallo-hydrolase [Rhodospirillales bacterium]